jgi:hypothetical protein
MGRLGGGERQTKRKREREKKLNFLYVLPQKTKTNQGRKLNKPKTSFTLPKKSTRS